MVYGPTQPPSDMTPAVPDTVLRSDGRTSTQTREYGIGEMGISYRCYLASGRSHRVPPRDKHDLIGLVEKNASLVYRQL